MKKMVKHNIFFKIKINQLQLIDENFQKFSKRFFFIKNFKNLLNLKIYLFVYA